MKRPSADKPELLRWLQMQGDADRRILAQLWSLPPDGDVAALMSALSDPQRVHAIWERLPAAERAALTRVLQDGGALPAAILEREWGPVRDPARFANPRAYLHVLDAPTSPAERLYMMGLLVRHHDDRGPVFRVLNDLRSLLPAVAPRDRRLRVAPLAIEPEAPCLGGPAETEGTVLALLKLADEGALTVLDDGALNKASLVKVAGQIAPTSKLGGVRREADWPWVALLRIAATEAGLLRRTTDGRLHLGPVGEEWLKAPRAERFRMLLDGWARAPINDLTLFGGLTWRTPSFALRWAESHRMLLDLVATLPLDVWLPAKQIAAEIERVEPDFLRRDGRYDTGLIYDERGKLVSGREEWARVEGELVHFVLLGLLYWLGLTDIDRDRGATAIRLTPVAAYALQDAPLPSDEPPAPIVVQGTFEVLCPPEAALYARFQLGRIAEVVSEDTTAIYRLTRRSILRAAERGIDLDQILSFLDAYGQGGVPQAVAVYLREWAGQVGQFRLEEAALLRAEDPIRLIELRRARGIALPPVEELTPTTWKIATGDVAALVTQAQRAGFSVEVPGAAAQLGRSARSGPLSEHDLKALVTAAYAYASICADLGLPCEVSSSMVMRLRKLVPSRHIALAERAAADLRERVRCGDGQPDLMPTSGGEHDA
jgi:hypothetical protein